MVFHSISGEETPNTVEIKKDERVSPPMASSPLKSQPLHNFPLPDMKWTAEEPKNQHFSVDSADSGNRNSLLVMEDDKNATTENNSVENMEIEGSDIPVENSEQQSIGLDKKSRILVRFRVNSQKSEEEGAEEAGDEKSNAEESGDEKSDAEEAGDQEPNAEEAGEMEGKTWNLRPRKQIAKPANAGGGGVRNGKHEAQAAQEIRSKRAEFSRTRKLGEGKKEKPKFSYSLTRQEIEDDFSIFAGARPSRRPRKRAKNVQKQLDHLSPGMYLASVTPDTYKVPDDNLKRGRNSILAELR